MKKWIVVLMVAAMMLTVLTGCGDKKSETSSSTPSGTQVQTQTQTKSSGDSRLDDIIKKGTQAKEMSFEMVINMSAGSNSLNTTSKMFISDKKFRMESEMMGVKSITIVNDKGETYMYDQTTNTAMKLATVPNSETPSNWYKDPSSMKVVSEEKKNGVDCLVVTTAQGGISSKLWLSKDTGMPVYTEQTTSQGLVTAEFKNFKVGPQPASLFEIPAGAKITTMNAPTKP